MSKTWALVGVSMLAFAANSLFCRMALANTHIDPGLFTVIRVFSGALCLCLLVLFNQPKSARKRAIFSVIFSNAKLVGAIALFIYAAGFSYAYVNMSTGTGALLLFGAVQLTMLCVSYFTGERFSLLQWIGFGLALAGLIVLLLPSASTPPLVSAVFMVMAGMAWGVYSLLGKKAVNPLRLTAGNFAVATIISLPLLAMLAFEGNLQFDIGGVIYALASGIIASGCGYAIWYKALPLIRSTTAATVQLSVPVIATLMGWVFLAEAINMQIIVASLMTLGGIGLVIAKR